MASEKRFVLFANFICHFGEREMLDLCDEVVIPAFTNESYRRTYADTEYFFHDVQLVTLKQADGRDEPAIAGKFVKNTVIHRDQVYKEKKLVHSPYKVESAPSSFFVLVLRDHKLLFTPEVRGAPGLESFGTTVERFLRSAHLEFVERRTMLRLKREFPERVPKGEKGKVRRAVLEKYPSPDLEIVSLASEDSFEAFVNRFDLVKSLTVRLLRPNNEINNDGFFEGLRKKGTELDASTSTLGYRNPSGLKKQKVRIHAENAMDGNAEISLAGTDTDGRKLSGMNDDFKIQASIDQVPKLVGAAAQALFEVFMKYRRSGHVRTGKEITSPEKESKLKRLAQEFTSRRGKDG